MGLEPWPSQVDIHGKAINNDGAEAESCGVTRNAKVDRVADFTKDFQAGSMLGSANFFDGDRAYLVAVQMKLKEE